MRSSPATNRRLIEVTPLALALMFHAIAFDRWLLILPIQLLLAMTVLSGAYLPASKGRLAVVVGVGVLSGAAVLGISDSPSGPLPPAVASALTGMLIGLATLFLLTRQVVAAWGSAWILVALSGNGAASSSLLGLQIAFMASLLLATAALVSIRGGGVRSLFMFGLFAVLVGGATYMTVDGLRQLDRKLQKTLLQLVTGESLVAHTGLVGDIVIGSKSVVKMSQEPVLELSEKPQRLRVHMMDLFDGHRWSTSSTREEVWRAFADIPRRERARRELQMVFLAEMGNDFPAPAGTWEVQGAYPRIEEGWILRGRKENANVLLIGDAQERLPAEPEPGAESLAVPREIRKGLGPLAQELTAAAKTNREKAESLERFFQRNFTYSLNTNLVGDRHPLILLVQERRPAYCVYFASAMALMLRTQGVPARIASGFAPADGNPITGRVTVRQRDAHAWVEAWLPEEQRFVAFDPTPAASRSQAIGTAETQGLASAGAEALVSIARRAWLFAQEDPAKLLSAVASSPITWIALAALLGVFLWYRRQGLSHLVRERSLEASDPILRSTVRRYVRALRRAGFTPRPCETDEELLSRLAETGDPQLATKATEFIASYRLARYRGDTPDARLRELARIN